MTPLQVSGEFKLLFVVVKSLIFFKAGVWVFLKCKESDDLPGEILDLVSVGVLKLGRFWAENRHLCFRGKADLFATSEPRNRLRSFSVDGCRNRYCYIFSKIFIVLHQTNCLQGYCVTSSGADPAEPCAGTIGLRPDPAWLSCAARGAVVLLPRVGTLQKLKNCIFWVIFFFF